MLTIFTIPKPFRGHAGVIQRNALESWRRLSPTCEVLVCGDDEGVAEVCAAMKLRHIPGIARNEYGTPRLDDAFRVAKAAASHRVLCYVNADIMFTNDLPRAAAMLPDMPYLMVGHRWDVDVREPLDFDDGWEARLREMIASGGAQHSSWGIDYFVFPRDGWMREMPPFVVGRPGWDNWFIYEARRRRVPVVDASGMVCAIHQNHDYDHVPERRGEKWVGPEADAQIRMIHELMGGSHLRFAIVDATHRLTPGGVARNTSLRSLRRRWTTCGALHPGMRWIVEPTDRLLQHVDRLRHVVAGRD